jgi:hypothetical protein
VTITDDQLMSLQARLDRVGLHLTVRSLARIHQILDDCQPDRRSEGSQHELLQLVRERMQRDRLISTDSKLQLFFLGPLHISICYVLLSGHQTKTTRHNNERQFHHRTESTTQRQVLHRLQGNIHASC